MIWKRSATQPLTNGAFRTSGRRLSSLAYKGEDEFISKLESHISEAAQRENLGLAVHDSKNSPALQLLQVENARNRGEKGIIINLVTPDSAPQILKAAQNMKVVLVNRAPADMSLLNTNTVYVGSDEAVAGRLQGEWLANYLKERGKNEVRYILLEGQPHALSARQRTEAVLKALEDNGIRAISVTPPIVANYDRHEAMTKILPILRSGVNFDAIISNNDAMALGAIEAFEYLNMDPSKKIILGIDATEPAIRALLEGKLDMTVFQNARAQGDVAVAALINMINGNPPTQGTNYQPTPDNPHVIWIPFELVTRQQIPRDLHF